MKRSFGCLMGPGRASGSPLAPPQKPRDGSIRRAQRANELAKVSKNPPTIRRLTWETTDA